MSASTTIQIIGVLAGATAAVYSLVTAQAWFEAVVIATLSIAGLWSWWRAREREPREWSDRMMGWLLAAILGFLVVADELKESRDEYTTRQAGNLTQPEYK